MRSEAVGETWGGMHAREFSHQPRVLGLSHESTLMPLKCLPFYWSSIRDDEDGSIEQTTLSERNSNIKVSGYC